MQALMPVTDKTARIAITVLTIAFLGISIWNIYQQHRYRVMDFELRKKLAEKGII